MKCGGPFAYKPRKDDETMRENYLVIRKSWEENDMKRDEGLTTPEGIERFDNLVYGTDSKWQSLDVYRPRNAEGRLPVIVSFHGGAWVYGYKEIYQYYCMNLAERGFAVVNYNYRLAPENRFPAAMEDTNAVFAWIISHKEEYGFDTDHIFAVGDSAGAMGIALYACLATNATYAEKYAFHVPEELKIRGVALNCGLYTARGRAEDLVYYLPQSHAEEALDLLHVTDHITPSFPPSYVMTSNCDFLNQEPPALLEQLEKHGVPYRYQMYGDKANPLYHVFHCDIKSEWAKQANDDECEFFRSLM